MKRKNQLPGIVGVIILCFLCLKPALFGAPYRIQVVGDSISVGFTDNPNWNVPFQFGWRSGLYTRLTNSGMSFQFVGNSPEPWNGTSGTVKNTPTLDLRTIDQDHSQGHGGVGTGYVAANIAAWLAVDRPDIVLLMIGINDIGNGSSGEPNGAEQNLNSIVATIVNNCPNTRVIVAPITPYSGYTDSIVRYNNYIQNTLVPSYAAMGKLVSTVNQYTNMCVAGTSTIDSSLFANGINHPGPVGYDRMAQTWFAGIQALGLPASAPEPTTVTNLVVNGGFETPVFGNNTVNRNAAVAGSGWTCTGNGGIDRGDPYGNSGSAALDGMQQGALQSSGNSSVSHISQVVSNFVVGQYYQLTFGSKAITGFSGANWFKVGMINGTATNLLFDGSFLVPGTSGYTFYTSAPFQASNTVMTLDFFDRGMSTAAYVSWIDAVSIYAVPAPAIKQTVQSGSSVNAFDGAIAASLIRAGKSSLGSVVASHGPTSPAAFTTAGLNDGSAAANANLTYYATTDSTGPNLPVTITFNLNTNSTTGGSPAGYAVTNIQVISGWGDSYLANQSFQLLFSLNGGSYVNYGTFTSFNFLNNGNNSLLQTLTGNGGPIASGVTGVQFIFQSAGGAQGGSGGILIRELQVFGSPLSVVTPTPVLVTDTLPAAAENIAGEQVVFTAAFGNSPAAAYQWQKIAGGVTNDIPGATASTLTLSNLQVADTGSYRLKAINATNSNGVTYSTARPLTVSSLPAPVNSVIAAYASQTGLGGGVFVPTWTVETNASLIAGQLPSRVGPGNFSMEVNGRSVKSLTDGGSGGLSIIPGNGGNTTSTNYVTCGSSPAGQSVTYALPTNSAYGYDLTNIVVYGGWADNGRNEQKYTVSYSTVASPTNFITLRAVDYNPNSPSGAQSATRVTFIPSGAVLARNVYAVKFDFDAAPENGYCGYSEITMFGTPSLTPVTAVMGHFPKPMQVCQRNLVTGMANVPVDGSVIVTGCAQVVVSVMRNGVLYTNLSQSLTYSGGIAQFAFSVPIKAELAGYNFEVHVMGDGVDTVVASANDVVAGDVYLINGQSNAEAMMYNGSANGNQHPYLRSFGTPNDSGSTVASDCNWRPAEGDTPGAGFVGQWGLHLGRLIIDNYGIPVAIINGARPGWPITSFLRNDANREDLGTDYGRTLFRFHQSGAQSLRAILWYQGESDSGDADAHEKGMISLHANWHEDYPTIEKIYVFQVHVGCLVNQFDTDLRNRQRLLPDRFDDVEVMSTTAVGQNTDNCHYPYSQGYETHAENIFRLVQRDLYGAAPRNDIEPPNPCYAYFSAPGHNQITVVMRNTDDTLAFAAGAKADFRLEGSAVTVINGISSSNTLVLTLSGDASAATGISYGGHISTAAPAIINANGVGLLAFFNLPIQQSLDAPGVPTGVSSEAISSERVDVSWVAATNASEYLISRDGAVIGRTTGTVFADTAAIPGVLYSYQVAASNLVATSAWSSATSAMTIPDNVFALVPEATNFTVLYRLDIPNDLRLGQTLAVPYNVDNTSLATQTIARVAYYLELQTNPGQPLKWVYVSCDPFTSKPNLLGVPSVASGAIFHQTISNLNVYASAGAGVATGQGMGNGNIEFWGWNYQTSNGYGVPGASDSTYDCGDVIDTNGTYASMQIHRAGQTLFAYNGWGAYTADGGSQSSDDLGIGTQPSGQPDWTFAANCFRYSYKRLYVLVRPLPPVSLTCAGIGDNWQLAWSQGVLLEATNVAGPWNTNLTARSPFTISPTEPQKYYRVRVQ